jgi:hypothetical protein
MLGASGRLRALHLLQQIVELREQMHVLAAA